MALLAYIITRGIVVHKMKKCEMVWDYIEIKKLEYVINVASQYNFKCKEQIEKILKELKTKLVKKDKDDCEFQVLDSQIKKVCETMNIFKASLEILNNEEKLNNILKDIVKKYKIENKKV